MDVFALKIVGLIWFTKKTLNVVLKYGHCSMDEANTK